GPIAVEPPTGLKSGISAIKQALSAAVTTTESAAQGADPLVFTGWFSDIVSGLTLESEKPVVEGINLLVVHIPSPNSVVPARAPRFIKPTPQGNPFSRSGFTNPRAPNMSGGGMMAGRPPIVSSYQVGVQQYGRKQYAAAEKSLRKAVAQN